MSFADVPALLKGLRDGGITATVMSVVDFTMAKKREPALRAGTFVGPRGSGAWGLRRVTALPIPDGVVDRRLRRRPAGMKR